MTIMTEARIDVAALDALLAPYDRTDAPGFAVGVALGGRPGYRRGVGMASIELPVVLSPSIRMRIGSTSKHFCVLALMLLVEEGRLSLDDSPRRHLPELPAWADATTIRQLMAHTSGMRDSLDLLLITAGPGKAGPEDLQLKLLAGLDSVDFAPGTSWSYNNGGYVLLSELVERLSGQSFGHFLKERILAPIGMYDTLLRELDTVLLPNSATLHVPLPDGGYARGVFGIPLKGEGGIVSTVDDMLLWLRHMSNPLIGTSAAWAEMRTPLATHGYGLGLISDTHRGLRTVHHSGGVIGGCCQMVKVLDHDLDIIAISNGRSVVELYGLVDAIIDACIPGLPPAPADSGGEPVAGDFHSPATGRVISLVAHGSAQAISFGGMVLPALRDVDGTIRVSIIPSDLSIKPVRQGREIVALDVTEYGNLDRLHLVTPPSATSLAGREGAYAHGPAGIEGRLYAGAGDRPRLLLSGPIGSLDYGLEPIGPNLWRTVPPDGLPIAATLEFQDDRFLLTTGRTRRLPFTRTA
ncbi:serine hydrolase [Sphingomonas sp. MAH-20]|uniref:Serine hydrolase n=1 Tax=Sphingomonas horti TaxID=2682842 RepID=A0A6I4J4A1_9SPHN|nr:MULTISPECIES: serine hydrolase domain-containing protein [Sphingomonas]MBA2921007.1 beta-lactamase family protein [Sphingomonas sp. CGMCC 1.13658]MVO79520.1 serine hydrolase [Sphingomonas horti]